MIKEVIQGKIDLLIEFLDLSQGTFDSRNFIEDKILILQEQLQQAKSIENIKQEEYQRGFTDTMNQYKQVMLDNMEKAFEAGREEEYTTNLGSSEQLKYETFEDYLKRNEIK
jgi:hypothetical protein